MGDDFALSRMRLSGRWMAYVDRYAVGHYGDGGLSVSMARLDGKASSFRFTVMSATSGDIRPRGVVTALMLDADGQMAWRFIANAAADGSLLPETYEALAVVDANGVRIVARGTPGAISRPRMRGAEVTWIANGNPGHTTLHGHLDCNPDHSQWATQCQL